MSSTPQWWVDGEGGRGGFGGGIPTTGSSSGGDGDGGDVLEHGEANWGEARSKREGRRRHGGAHHGRIEMAVAALIFGGVVMTPTTIVDRRQGGWGRGLGLN
jgi:hypothetical protein